MTTKKYITTHQYEPLNVPSGWGEEGRRLVNRLTEIFDDIYRRYGRLGVEDISTAFSGALDVIRENVRAADRKAENAAYSASESFAAANNASQQAYDAYVMANAAMDSRYGVGDCLMTTSSENPSGRYLGNWEMVGSGVIVGTETLYVWKRVS